MELLQHPSLAQSARRVLEEQKGEFLFGNTAPDVQVVSGQAREATHFFELPIHPLDQPAWLRLQQLYPESGLAANMPPSRRAFMAGYICHLQADWYWVLEIFMPVFGLRSKWETFGKRLYLHNVLRSYLDREFLPGLKNGATASLAHIQPAYWLPFVEDRYLVEWRDFLAGQLLPGASVQTVEVFAARQGISPDEYYRMLDSQEAMDREIFSRLPHNSLDLYRSQLVLQNIQFLNVYLGDPIQEPYHESD